MFLGTIAVLVIAVVAIAYPFRQRIGGAGGGAEKQIVGVLWFLGAIFLAILVATNR